MKENRNKSNPDNNRERKTECEIVLEWRPGGGLKRPWLGSVISDTSQQADWLDSLSTLLVSWLQISRINWSLQLKDKMNVVLKLKTDKDYLTSHFYPLLVKNKNYQILNKG